MWKSTVERGGPQMRVWRRRVACWISKATDTHSECVILYCFSTTPVVTRTRRNVTLQLHCLSGCDSQFVAARCRSSDNKRSQGSAVCFAVQNIDTAWHIHSLLSHAAPHRTRLHGRQLCLLNDFRPNEQTELNLCTNLLRTARYFLR
jgi:hypothetical protein